MIKAIIFDMDGVITDTDKTRFMLLQRLLKERGIDLKNNLYKKSIGKRTEFFLKEVLGNVLSDNDIRSIFLERKAEYHKNPKKYILTMPYAVSCCQKLYNSKYKLAIASSAEKRDIKLVLKNTGLLTCFKTFVGSDDIKIPKPNPEVYLESIKKLKLNNTECLAVEDSPIGIKAAKSAGLFCVAVTYTHPKKELSQADLIIDSLNKLNPKLIKQLQN